jgi:dTDP-4-dehydrorhamnose reductase
MSELIRNILIVGIDSEIGSRLASYLDGNGRYKIIGTTRREIKSNSVDICFHLDLETLESNLPKLNFHTIIFCAGITSQATCNDNPKLTWKINVENTIAAINQLASVESHVVFLSSCSVFDGSESFYKFTDLPNPISNYGKQKVEVEDYLQKNLARATILRLTKVISEETRFIKSWRESASKGESILAYTNRYLSPIGIIEVCNLVKSIIEKESFGLFQLGGDIEQSYFEYATSYFLEEPSLKDFIVPVEDHDVSGNTYNSLALNLPQDTNHS